MEATENGGSGKGVIMAPQREANSGIRFRNPFAFKVGQVFTGFGVGCGIGIGVGRPINLGAIPMVGQVMSATRGATDAFSGVTWHVNNALRKLGAKNIEAGIGCGVGFGHGFGVGFAIKPSVLQQVQACVMQSMMKMMKKLGVGPNLPIGQGAFPVSLQTGMNMISEPSNLNPGGGIMQLSTKVTELTSKSLPSYGDANRAVNMSGTADETAYGSRTEKVVSSFLENPIFRGEATGLNDVAERLRSENTMLLMVLKHQKVIEELMEENEKLRQILVEDLKVPPSKLQASNLSSRKSPCNDCFECRRKMRRRQKKL